MSESPKIKPRLKKVCMGWICEAPGTRAAFGFEPEDAFRAWVLMKVCDGWMANRMKEMRQC